MTATATALRRCLACGALEPVANKAPVWPLGWRCPACGHVVAEIDGIPVFAPDLADTVSGMDPKNFDELAGLEAGYFWFVTGNEFIGLANKFFPEARKFLEIGCGTGAYCANWLIRVPLMAASRLMGGANKQDDDCFREFRLNPHVNRLFTAMLRAEVAMTLARCRWPAGGSRIVLARAV
jgi:hypothetical protein